MRTGQEGPATRLPATFTASQAAAVGVSRRRLRTLQDQGEIEQIARGLYRHTAAPLADLDLIEVAVKVPPATLCLVSALSRHGLTDTIPIAPDIAVPRETWRPVLSVPVRWHRFNPETFDLGRDTIAIDDEHVIGIYNEPRTLVDVFRLRHAVGADVAYEALRRWLRHGGQPVQLMRIVNAFPAARPELLKALQILD